MKPSDVLVLDFFPGDLARESDRVFYSGLTVAEFYRDTLAEFSWFSFGSASRRTRLIAAVSTFNFCEGDIGSRISFAVSWILDLDPSLSAAEVRAFILEHRDLSGAVDGFSPCGSFVRN